MAIRVYDISESPLTVEVDTGGYGGLPLVEVWVRDAGIATFTVYGSHDGEEGTWRYIGELKVPHAGRDNRHEGYFNAYRHLRVSTDSISESEIEIVAGSN